MKILLGILLGIMLVTAKAQERILDFHSHIAIDAKGGLSVVETIAVQAEGREIRRGIFRDFPTGYRDRLGNKVTVPLQVAGVTRNGNAETYSLEQLSNGTRIRIGNAGVMLQRGVHLYEIRYRTAHQVGFFDRHDELYWNVNGNGWPFAFDKVSAAVSLPQRVPARDLRVEAYTGPFGARGRDYQSATEDGAAMFQATRKLGPGEGLTIVVAFPKGIVAEPTWRDRAKRLLDDNPGVGSGALGVAVLLALLSAAWLLFGRDPKPGPLYPRYEAPRGLGAAGVRYVDKQGYDDRCFAAALLGLGSRGALKIRDRGGGAIFDVEPTGKPPAQLHVGEKVLLESLARPITFYTGYDASVKEIRDRFAGALHAYFAPRRYYATNNWVILLALAIGLLTLWQMGKASSAVPAMVITAGVMVAATAFFAWRLMPAYSPQGRKVQDEIDGLRQYLAVAEKEDLARMKAPPQTAAEFSRQLPYAFALGVEATWADRFAATIGAAAVAAAVNEYYSGRNPESWDSPGGISSITESFSAMGDTISAASTPPGSTSGSSDGGGSSDSGGGSSGGGGGGGGGGGW